MLTPSSPIVEVAALKLPEIATNDPFVQVVKALAVYER